MGRYKTNIDPRTAGPAGERGRGEGGASRFRGGRRVFFFFSGVRLVDTMVDLLSFCCFPGTTFFVMGFAHVGLFF